MNPTPMSVLSYNIFVVRHGPTLLLLKEAVNRRHLLQGLRQGVAGGLYHDLPLQPHVGG